MATTPTFRAADSKREEFRKYLEKAGVMESLTKVLAGLYEQPEKPTDALKFIAEILGANLEGQPSVEALRAEVEDLIGENIRLREEVDKLRAELNKQGQTTTTTKDE